MARYSIRIGNDLLPSSAALITLLEDYQYLATLKAKLSLIKEMKRANYKASATVPVPCLA